MTMRMVDMVFALPQALPHTEDGTAQVAPKFLQDMQEKVKKMEVFNQKNRDRAKSNYAANSETILEKRKSKRRNQKKTK